MTPGNSDVCYPLGWYCGHPLGSCNLLVSDKDSSEGRSPTCYKRVNFFYSSPVLHQHDSLNLIGVWASLGTWPRKGHTFFSFFFFLTFSTSYLQSLSKFLPPTNNVIISIFFSKMLDFCLINNFSPNFLISLTIIYNHVNNLQFTL